MAKKKNKKTIQKKEEEEVFYVGIQDPVELKQSLVESSKDLVEYAERFENLKKIREEKKVQMDSLKSIFSEITKNNIKLKRLLPKTKLRIKLEKTETLKKKTKLVKAKTAPEKKTIKKIHQEANQSNDSEIAKLEKELAEIEGRLTKMS